MAKCGGLGIVARGALGGMRRRWAVGVVMSAAAGVRARCVSAHALAAAGSTSGGDTRTRRVVDAYWVGTQPYAAVLAWQRSLQAAAMAAGGVGVDSLILVEHTPVYTLGRGASLAHVKFLTEAAAAAAAAVAPAVASAAPLGDSGGGHGYGGAALVRVERGGEVTWHGPGQLVAYPILCLDAHRRDLHWYVRSLEEVGIRVLAALGVPGGYVRAAVVASRVCECAFSRARARLQAPRGGHGGRVGRRREGGGGGDRGEQVGNDARHRDQREL